MSNYNPDRWVILEIINPEDKVKTTEKVYKVFGGWYGGYTSGDSWRMNSGITKVIEDGELYHLHGYSGSVYTVHKTSYGMSGYMSQVYYSSLDAAEKAGVPFRYIPENELEGVLKSLIPVSA